MSIEKAQILAEAIEHTVSRYGVPFKLVEVLRSNDSFEYKLVFSLQGDFLYGMRDLIHDQPIITLGTKEVD